MRVKKKKKTSFKNTLSSFRARVLLTICIIRYYQVSIGLVFSIYDPTEVAISEMIDASQRMLKVNSQGGEELGRMSPPIKRHLELEIKTLQNAPRDADKLRWRLQVKQRQKEEAMQIEDTQRLITEIEMLRVVLHLVTRSKRRRQVV